MIFKSKTQVIEILKDMVKQGFLETEWKVEAVSHTRTRATKMYRLKSN